MDGQLWWFHHDSGGHERIPRAHHRAAVAHGERQQRVWPRLEGRYCSNVLRKTDSNAERYSDGNTDTDCNRNSNIYADTYGDRNTDCDGDSDSYTYFYTETFTDAESRADAEAASYAATAAVTSSCNHGRSLLRT